MKEKGRVTQMKTTKKREKYILALVFSLYYNYDVGVFFHFSQQPIFTFSFPPLFVLHIADLCSFIEELNHLENFKPQKL